MWFADADALSREVLAWAVAHGRILGFFMAAPWWTFRALGARTRVALTLLLAWSVHGEVMPAQMGAEASTLQALLYFTGEWLMGLVAGGVMRLGALALELMAEVLSQQAGLSFAASQLHEPTLQSNLLGQLLGLCSLALVFVWNLHLSTLEWLLASYRAWQPLFWPQAWDLQRLLQVFAEGFLLGVVWALPALTVLTAINLVQAVLGRLSPQFNMFSMGFALTVLVTLGMVLLMFLAFQDEAWSLLWEGPLSWLRDGWR